MASLPNPGDLFEGKYRIDREIGSGGSAAVFHAVDQATGRAVAIKVLVPQDHDTGYGERLHARFEREARLLAGLRSQHTVTMYEFGQSADGLLYLVFEYVNGTTLRDLVRLKGAQQPARVVAILRQVCTALHEAHSTGILHRDIKPANIMVYDHLEMTDVVKLLDFGIAKSIGEGPDDGMDQTITTAGAVLGTPRYMSPEQLAHQPLTPASDIYSLGLVAYELLCGERAIGEESPTGILRAQLSTDPIIVPRERAIPLGLRRVVEKMVHKQRAERYQDLAAVLRDLEHWDEGDNAGGVARYAAVGLFIGLLLLGLALTMRPPPPQPVAAPEVERLLGRPMYGVSLDTPATTYIWVGNSITGELKGGMDPRAIEPLARTVVAVEREGVPQAHGKRWVGSLADWDGRTLSHELVVREIDEGEFRAQLQALRDGLRTGRSFMSRINRVAMTRARELGLPVQTTQVGWTRYFGDDADGGTPAEGGDGLPFSP